jgi:hypothetical protein
VDGQLLPCGSFTVPDTFCVFDGGLQRYKLRVRAEDAQGRLGPWSLWSREPWGGLSLTVWYAMMATAAWPDSMINSEVKK